MPKTNKPLFRSFLLSCAINIMTFWGSPGYADPDYFYNIPSAADVTTAGSFLYGTYKGSMVTLVSSRPASTNGSLQGSNNTWQNYYQSLCSGYTTPTTSSANITHSLAYARLLANYFLADQNARILLVDGNMTAQTLQGAGLANVDHSDYSDYGGFYQIPSSLFSLGYIGGFIADFNATTPYYSNYFITSNPVASTNNFIGNYILNGLNSSYLAGRAKILGANDPVTHALQRGTPVYARRQIACEVMDGTDTYALEKFAYLPYVTDPKGNPLINTFVQFWSSDLVNLEISLEKAGKPGITSHAGDVNNVVDYQSLENSKLDLLFDVIGF